MGRLALVIDFDRTTEHDENIPIVKIDLGGGEGLTSQMCLNPGIDAVPCDGDYAATSSTVGDNGEVVIGFTDSDNTPKAKKGEIRAYARDTNGVQVVEIYLKNDGSLRIENDKGSIELKANGEMIVNNGTEPAVLGNKFMKKDNAHTHSTAFGPSGSPIVPWTVADFSETVKLK